MPNPYILRSVTEAWSREGGRGKRALDLSSGHGETSFMLRSQGFSVVATGYRPPRIADRSIDRVGGVDLNQPLPFQSASFDGVNLTEVIEHIENQAQLVREVSRVLKEGGVFVVSTPNILNVFSRIRFLFTGFLRGRVRPVHYSHKPGEAHNVYLMHFYELYYLLFHYGFEIEGLRKTRVKFAPLFFLPFFYPLMWLFSLVAVIHAEKDRVQRAENWRILKYLFDPALLLSDNFVVRAKKKRIEENRLPSIPETDAGRRDSPIQEIDGPQRRSKRAEGRFKPPNPRRRQRLALFNGLIGGGHERILELGCGLGDLSYSLRRGAGKVIGVDISHAGVGWAKMRRFLWSVGEDDDGVEFLRMSAVRLGFAPSIFDYVVSTSMVEHLDPSDFEPHLREVRRVLKPGGRYLIWCPNRLGHHGDRTGHVNMLSYQEVVDKMRQNGFENFMSPCFNRPRLVDVGVKIFLERAFSRLGVKFLWSHLGIRNICVVATKV